METKTIQDKATEALTYFTSATRTNGDVFIKAVDNVPKWIESMCYEAHDGMSPDDWKYQFIVDVLGLIQEQGEDYLDNIETDVYTNDLLEWLASRNDRLTYCDQARSEGLLSDKCNMVQRVTAGQYMERMEVADLVYNFLENINDEEMV